MEKLKENETYRFNLEKGFLSGTKLIDEKGNVFEVCSSLDLEWLMGEEEFKKSEYKEKYYVTVKFLRRVELKASTKKSDSDNNTKKEDDLNHPLPQ